jgi:DNA replication protein DnaC
MEDLGDILKRLATRSTSGDRPPDDLFEGPEPCGICGGLGWLTSEVPVGHPEFGRLIICECQQQEIQEDQYSRLLRYSGLGYLTRFTFESLKPEGLADEPESQQKFQAAYGETVDFCDKPSGWLVIAGPHGSGKTHLAAAIGNRCIERGHVVFFSHVPDLLDHLRATYSPTSDVGYSELFEQVRSTPLLILDGLGSHSTTPWAEEKLRQIINHRYNAELPTVVTTAVPMEQLDEQISSRLLAPGLGRILELRSKTADPAGRLGGVEPELLRRMTFETFDVRGNSPTAGQRASLEHAFTFARHYADQPDGWVTFFGETGVGKTHLAVAVAAERLKAGHPVFFIMVADLLDHLRATFAPSSPVTYDVRFEEIKNSPLLVLDDLGKERGSPWAEEKLHQIIVHRHNARLPTIITTLVDFTRPEEQGPVGSRIQDPSVGELIRLQAPDYRNKRQRRGRATTKGKATR